MQRFEHYHWPFFEERHRQLARDADAWIRENPAEENDTDSTCRTFVRKLGAAGFLEHCVSATPDVRSIALLREVFAYHHGLADFAFVMQGLGSGSIVLAGSDAQKKAWLPRVAAGEAIAAFALSEPMRPMLPLYLLLHGSSWKINGTKT
jgi:acyl-CoA dehydrogenase